MKQTVTQLIDDIDGGKADETVSFALGRRTSAGFSGVDPKAVRAWAASNKIQINDRGRIPASVVEQYRAAGN
jgi:hypothetical protein